MYVYKCEYICFNEYFVLYLCVAQLEKFLVSSALHRDDSSCEHCGQVQYCNCTAVDSWRTVYRTFTVDIWVRVPYLHCRQVEYGIPYLHCGQVEHLYRTCTVDSWSTVYRICTVDRWSPVYCSRYLYYGQLENCWQVENCVLCTATVMYTRVSNFAP